MTTIHTFYADHKCAAPDCEWTIPYGHNPYCQDHGGPRGPEHRTDPYGRTKWRGSERDDPGAEPA